MENQWRRCESHRQRIKQPAFEARFIVTCNMTISLAFVDLFSLKDVHTHTVYAGALRTAHFSFGYEREKAPGNRLDTSIQAERDNDPGEMRFSH